MPTNTERHAHRQQAAAVPAQVQLARAPRPGRDRRSVWVAVAAGSTVLVVAAVLIVVALRGGPADAPVAGPADPSLSAAATPAAAPAATSAGPPAASATIPATQPPSVAGQWISVDPVAQAKATADFFAMKPKPVTGNPTTVPEFHASCTVSHHGSDDPIVFPGVAGVSHNHAFIGNKTTDANSTVQSLFAGATNCAPAQDHSAYWIPTLYQNGKIVDPSDKVTVYYGSRLKDPSRTQPFPFGLRMISGDPRVQTDNSHHEGNHFWCAGIGGEVGRTADGVWPVCAKTAKLTRQLTFPDCWDGKHLDSPDHKAHMSNGVAGKCPASHPVPIPSLSFVISYPLSTNMSGLSFSSGTSFSFHGDFYNAWEPQALAQRTRDCVDQDVKCNDAGNF